MFAAVLLFILLPPFIPNDFWGGFILVFLLSIVAIQSAYLLFENPKHRKYGFAIGLIVLAVIWIAHFMKAPDVEIGEPHETIRTG